MRAQFKNTSGFGIRRTAFTVALFALLSFLVSPLFACDAPVEQFCVDFYKGRNPEGAPVVSSKVPYIKYQWGNHSPVDKVPHGDFSARWRGLFQFTDSQYVFRASADEGVRIMLDGQPIIDHWDAGQGLIYRTQINPGAGTHLVEVEYFHGTGRNAYVEAKWEKTPITTTPNKTNISSSKSIKRIIPTLNSKTLINDSTGTYESKNNSKLIDKKTPVLNSNKYENHIVETHRNNLKAPLGINLSYFSYSSASVPFKDLITQSGLKGVFKKGTNEPCFQQPTLDTTGYPQYLPKGCVFRLTSVFHILNDEFWPADTLPYQPGRYVLLYHGRGKIRLGWDAKKVVHKNKGRIEFDVPSPNAGIQVEVTKIDATNPIKDMHIVHINDEASFRTQPFNDKWLNLLKPFSLIRFVDWGRVNEKIKVYSGTALSHTSKSITLPSSAPSKIKVFDNKVAMVNVNGKWPRVMIDSYDGETRTLYLKTPIEISTSGNQPTVYIYDFLNRVWADRTRPINLEQGSLKGLAFETMIQLANTLNVNPWINIPTAANDDFVEQLAVLIKNQLNPNLKCYIEYSNETWNTAFPGYNYAEAKSRELELMGTSPQADSWHAYRAVEIFRIFNQVFGEQNLREDRMKSRLVRILTSQTAWLDRGLRVMDWEMPNNAWPTQGYPAHKYADAWAGTTYFYLKGNKTLEQTKIDELFTLQINNIDTMFGTAHNPGIIRQTLSEVNKRGLQLVAYEGGTHLLAPVAKPDLVAKLAQVNKDLGMTEVYTHLLSKWDSLYKEFGSGKVGVWNHYSDVSRYSKYGYWGLLQSTYQDSLSAPKYQAIKEYVLESQ